MDFQCSFQDENFCVVLTGFLGICGTKKISVAKEPRNVPSTMPTDEMGQTWGILAGNNFDNVGHHERQAASWQPDMTCCSGGSGMRVSRVLRPTIS